MLRLSLRLRYAHAMKKKHFSMPRLRASTSMALGCDSEQSESHTNAIFQNMIFY